MQESGVCHSNKGFKYVRFRRVHNSSCNAILSHTFPSQLFPTLPFPSTSTVNSRALTIVYNISCRLICLGIFFSPFHILPSQSVLMKGNFEPPEIHWLCTAWCSKLNNKDFRCVRIFNLALSLTTSVVVTYLVDFFFVCLFGHTLLSYFPLPAVNH